MGAAGLAQGARARCTHAAAVTLADTLSRTQETQPAMAASTRGAAAQHSIQPRNDPKQTARRRGVVVACSCHAMPCHARRRELCPSSSPGASSSQRPAASYCAETSPGIACSLPVHACLAFTTPRLLGRLITCARPPLLFVEGWPGSGALSPLHGRGLQRYPCFPFSTALFPTLP